MKKQLPTKLHERILVSFNHAVALVIGRHAIFTSGIICEEIHHGEVSVSPKEEKGPSPSQAMEMASSLTIDFPIMLRVLSLADGKMLSRPVDIIVKWNNISAICYLKEEDEI